MINRGAGVLIADMTDTVSIDHAAVDALARAYQRARLMARSCRLVVAAPVIRRVLTIEGLDRLVSIYPVLEAAIAEKVPGGSRRATSPGADTRQESGTAWGLTSVSGVRVITPTVLWQVLDALDDGLALTDEDGKIALVNRRCAEMFGYRREELTGLPVDELVPSEVREAHHGYRIGYHRAPQTRPMADRARLVGLRRDGTTFPVEISLSPVPTATENCVLAVIRDATAPAAGMTSPDLARDAAADQPPADQGAARPRRPATCSSSA